MVDPRAGGGSDCPSTRVRTAVVGATEASNDYHGTTDDGPWEQWGKVIAMFEDPYLIIVECFDRGC